MDRFNILLLLRKQATNGALHTSSRLEDIAGSVSAKSSATRTTCLVFHEKIDLRTIIVGGYITFSWLQMLASLPVQVRIAAVQQEPDAY